ncbi:hypothetical protein [Christiangramia salexigens]|uniref:Uncharacterized protein n=1 Tax=Christiangramia salexigens TaxID=1913577 RepID=A0A1L3J444_9FLAO|nr:hypothetical protein [Christiangramia salexigens]APG59901.1 hypothetical protein LPB144_05500 [Christiangramia salexigens]
MNPQDSSREDLQETEIQHARETRHSQDLPRLYSKRVIWAFAILFSTLFAAVLLMSNMKSMDEKKGRMQVLIFGILFTIGVGISVETTQASSNLALPLNLLGGIILNEYFWNRYIGKEQEFEKKNWTKPAIISILICIPFALLLIFGQKFGL